MENGFVLSERPCPITGKHECEVIATKAREGHSLRNVISKDSGLIFVDPLPIEDLSQFYKEDYRKSYKNVVTPKKKHIYRAGGVALDRWERLESYLQPGTKAIDFGAGGGEWAYLLKSRGVDVYGIEPNQGYGGFARESYGLDLFLGMYQEADVERGSFEIATLFHVLEHLRDPIDDLRNMSAFLRDEAYFAIEVPDILYAGMHFDHKWHDGHLFGFDVATLEAVAAKAGLHTVTLERDGGNLFGIFQKREAEETKVPNLSNHCEMAKQELERGRTQYWTMPHTYLKPLRKLQRTVSEKRAVSASSRGREILDSLYQKSWLIPSMTETHEHSSEEGDRIAGILVPSFSIRTGDDLGIGDTEGVRQFLEFAAELGFGFVQLLPINEIGHDNSPYNAISSVALEPLTIDCRPGTGLEDLSQEAYERILNGYDTDQLRKGPVNYTSARALKRDLLEEAFFQFKKHHLGSQSPREQGFLNFCKQEEDWLDDYCVYRFVMELEKQNPDWQSWDPKCQTLAGARAFIDESIAQGDEWRASYWMLFFAYVQWIARTQWKKVSEFGRTIGIRLMGDIPIGISAASADVFIRSGNLRSQLVWRSAPGNDVQGR